MFGITRQAYYNHRKRGIAKQIETELIIKRVKAIRSVHPRMGCRKIHELLKEELVQIGIKIGRDKLFDLLSDNQLLIRRRKRRTKTTNSYHMFKKHKNLIKGFTPYQAGQLWVSDITYIRNKETFKYLFLITDAYSRKIVGHKIADSLETKHAIQSMKMAIKQASNIDGLIHHSDRGVQYCCHKYVKLLQDYKIRISMTEDSNPTDNSIAERVNGILKEEYIEPLNNTTNIMLEEIVSKAIHRYNYYRPHLSCDMKTPNEAHKLTGSIKKRWKNYYTVQNENN